MKNKIYLVFISISIFLLYSFVSDQKEFDLHKIVSKLNEKQFEELKKISIKDSKGFKFVKEHLGKDNFTSFASTKSINNEITKEDERKILEIIKKYK